MILLYNRLLAIMSQSAGYFRAQVLLRYHYASNLNWDFSECRCQWSRFRGIFPQTTKWKGYRKNWSQHVVKAVKGVRILFQFLEMGYESFPHNTTAYTLKTEGKTDSTCGNSIFFRLLLVDTLTHQISLLHVFFPWFFQL